MSPFETISLIIAVLGISVIWLQIKADHERRKKQATIEFLNSIRPVWLENETRIYKSLGRRGLTEADIPKILEDDDLRESIKTLLGRLEYMAVGINTGVFDEYILYRMAASYLIKIYHRLYPYIIYIQKNKNPYAYVEFKELVIKFEDLKRRRPDPRGRIKLS